MLVERGLAESRTRAQALVAAGRVFAGPRRVEKPGELLDAGTPLVVRGRDHPWVSRGGVKLAHALDHFGLSPAGLIALDIGASTGGFTHVLLARGALRVHAVDVGRGQLAWALRTDPRVAVHEGVNARRLSVRDVPEPVQAITCDASFISLAKVLARPLLFAAAGAWLVALVKPQFEAGRREVGKGGVVRDPAVHARVVEAARHWVEAQGWAVLGTTPSPVRGADGNVEFLLAARKTEAAEWPPPPP
ncbi:MAG: TlyA family RNA methyltransferase [Sphingomonadaceae bacterium]|nr:TlyA family RNA methyltransferase [Thermaurantiacus sp.]MCS6985997.1 TlyA family RNA methyltransferase [Sphingomonadaceae bacterium]MDW8414787.1 TlyA family RNA methyltransferase [Thermaurantiacus sp.]